MARADPTPFDFALFIGGVDDLSATVEAPLFKAGCGDATFSIPGSRMHADFSRSAATLAAGILSAVRDVHGAGIGATGLHVDSCDLAGGRPT